MVTIPSHGWFMTLFLPHYKQQIKPGSFAVHAKATPAPACHIAPWHLLGRSHAAQNRQVYGPWESKSSKIHQRDSFLKDLGSCCFLFIHPWTWTYKIVLHHHLKLIMDTCSCLLVNYNGGTQAIKMLPMLARKKKTETADLQKKAWKLPGNPLCIFPRPKKAVFSAGLLSGRVVIHG